MLVQQKKDYASPTCQPVELKTESFICSSLNQSMDLGLEMLQEDTYTWTIF